MPSRQRSRQHALQMLYLLDMREQPVEEAILSFYASLASEEGEPTEQHDDFAEMLVRGTLAKRVSLDKPSPLIPNTGGWTAWPWLTATYCAWRPMKWRI